MDGRALRSVRQHSLNAKQLADQTFLVLSHLRRRAEALPSRPHPSPEPRDRHRHHRQLAEPGSNVEHTLTAMAKQERRRPFALRQVPRKLRHVVAKPAGLIPALLKHRALVRRRMSKTPLVGDGLERAKERPRKRLLQRRRVPNHEVQVRYAPRLILEHPKQDARPLRFRPTLPPQLTDRSCTRRVQSIPAPRRPKPPLLLSHRIENPAAQRPRTRYARSMAALRPIPPPRFSRARQHPLQHPRLRSEEVAVRVHSPVDHRSKRRRPRRPNRITPAPTARPPLTPDRLPAPTRTPTLRLVKPTAPDRIHDRVRPRKRLQLRSRVHVPVPPGASRTCRLPNRTSLDNTLQPDLIRVDTTTHERTANVRRREAAPWVACDPPTPLPLPTCDRRDRSVPQTPLFLRELSQSCASFLPAQRDFSHSFALNPPSGGGGNRTRVRGRTDRASTSVVRALRSPGGRFANDLPTG